MRNQQRITVDLAVQILRLAMQTSGSAKGDTVPVRLALRCLWSHCPERWPLITYWESCVQAHDIGREQGMTAAFNAIVRQLRKSGAWTD
jgi:hypothetical protein